MKRNLFIALSAFFFITAHAQTWVQRLSGGFYNPFYVDDTICGVKNVELGADGNLYFLGKITQQDEVKLFKMPPNGGAFLWTVSIGYHSTMQVDQAVSMKATSDGGCIVVLDHDQWAASPSTITFIKKYSSTGGLQWSTLVDYCYTSCYVTGYDVIQNSSGNYDVLISDSLYELNSSGNVVFVTGAVSGTQLFQLAGGDLLVRTHNNSIVRTDISGNVLWTYSPVNPIDIVCFSSSAAFVCDQLNHQLKKINISFGNAEWNIPVSSLPFSAIDATSDGGVIAANGYPAYVSAFWPANYWPNPQVMNGTLSKYDGGGILQWSKNYDFPRFGLTWITQIPSGYITGGTWAQYSLPNAASCPGEYKGFVARLDNAGSGLFETTDMFWPRNVDGNDTIDFANDLLLTAMAMGASGLPREQYNFPLEPLSPTFLANDFAFDWPQWFCDSINYKYADNNGDGIINMADLTCGWLGFGNVVIPCRLSGEASVNALYDFSVVPAQPTAIAGDTVTFYLIAGAVSPIDSVYGMAAVLNYNGSPTLFDMSYKSINAVASDFGIPSNNMLQVTDTSGFYMGLLGFLICRTDQNHAYNLHDTVGIVRLRVNPNLASPATITMGISQFSARTKNNCLTLPLTYGGSSVSVSPVVTSIDDSEYEILFYQNPTSDALIIKSPEFTGKTEFAIYNTLGKKIYSRFQPAGTKTHIIDISELIPGVYFLMAKTKSGDFTGRFVKM